jgi:hypothetical protein
VNIDVEPPDDAADADPEVDECEVHPEVLLTQVALDDAGDEGVEAHP